MGLHKNMEKCQGSTPVSELMWIVAPRGRKPRLTNTSVFNMHQDAGIVDAVNFVEVGKLAFKAIYVTLD